MEFPSWQNTKMGTMKRAALWLVSEVGEGNVFTKAQLREAFPDVSQIDRRMRDLRDHGWRIDTNREDLNLDAHEQRFVQQGEPVWEPGKATKAKTLITATQRRELIQQDGHLCRSCGIAPGQTFAGTYEAAQLDVARRQVRQPNGTETVELVIECNRCRVGGRGLTADLGKVLARIRNLSSFERKILAGWVSDEQREFSQLEQLWAEYRALPAESRAAVKEALMPGQAGQP
jgi:hypothetical protein